MTISIIFYKVYRNQASCYQLYLVTINFILYHNEKECKITQMKKTSISKKLALFFFAIIVTLVVLEAALRIAGFIQVYSRDHINRLKLNKKNTHIILCIGESTTYLGEENSYPNQLEQILNKNSKSKKFIVINKGLPGIGTGYILENVNNWIKEYNPDIIVAMMGVNDHNTLIPVDQASTEENIMHQLRVYKLTQWIIKSFSYKFEKKNTTLPTAPTLHAKSKPTHDVVMEHVNSIPVRYRVFYNYGMIFLESGQADRAEKVFRALIERNLDSVLNNYFYQRLGESLLPQNKYIELTKVFHYLLKQNPYDGWVTAQAGLLCQKPQGSKIMLAFLERFVSEDPTSSPRHDLLGACYAHSGLEKKAQSHLAKSSKLRIEKFNPITKKNYIKLAKILSEKEIKPVFVQYPMRSIAPIKNYFSSSQLLKKIVFVDNEKIFKDAADKGKYEDLFWDRFGGNFGHCTPEGNRLLATNIADAILKALSGK